MRKQKSKNISIKTISEFAFYAIKHLSYLKTFGLFVIKNNSIIVSCTIEINGGTN